MAALKHNGTEIARIHVEHYQHATQPDTWIRDYSVRSNGWILQQATRIDERGRRDRTGWKRWKNSNGSDLKVVAEAVHRVLAARKNVKNATLEVR